MHNVHTPPGPYLVLDRFGPHPSTAVARRVDVLTALAAASDRLAYAEYVALPGRDRSLYVVDFGGGAPLALHGSQVEGFAAGWRAACGVTTALVAAHVFDPHHQHPERTGL